MSVPKRIAHKEFGSSRVQAFSRFLLLIATDRMPRNQKANLNALTVQRLAPK